MDHQGKKTCQKVWDTCSKGNACGQAGIIPYLDNAYVVSNLVNVVVMAGIIHWVMAYVSKSLHNRMLTIALPTSPFLRQSFFPCDV